MLLKQIFFFTTLISSYNCVIDNNNNVFKHYVYDRAICTGLGDRVGTIMTLATLAKMNHIDVVFRWCGDPSEIFPRLHKHIPMWHGYDYNFTEFKERFLPPSLLFHIKFVTPDLNKKHKESPYKVVCQGLSVPAEAGLNQVYTTAWKTMEIPGRPILDGEHFKQNYHWVTRSVVLHARSVNQNMINAYKLYIAVHMRGPDYNTPQNPVDCHDNPNNYCTGKVLRKIIKKFPDIRILVMSNNISWTQRLLHHKRIEILNNSNAYDDFSLFLGASAIVQHANYGWSAYSSNPAMMTGIPLITTYQRHLPNHHFDLLKQYGGIPREFHDCSQIKIFLTKLNSMYKKE